MLKETRKKTGLSQKEVSQRSGISLKTIQHYEQGERDINGANLKTLLKLCDVLNCRLEDLLTDTETIELLDKQRLKHSK